MQPINSYMNKLKTILTILLAISVLTGWADDAKILSQSKGSISFVVDENLKEVPEVLRQLKRIETLKLEFIDEVTLPEWFFDVKFERLDIRGKMSEKTRERLKKRWPKASLYKDSGKDSEEYRFMFDKNVVQINKDDIFKL